MPETSPATMTYATRVTYAQQILEAFHRDLPHLLKYFRAEQAHGNRKFIDAGISIKHDDTWTVRWDTKTERIIRLWQHEPIPLARTKETWLTMALDVPAYVDSERKQQNVPLFNAL